MLPKELDGFVKACLNTRKDIYMGIIWNFEKTNLSE